MRSVLIDYCRFAKTLYFVSPVGRCVKKIMLPIVLLIQFAGLVFLLWNDTFSASVWWGITLSLLWLCLVVWVGVVFLTSKESLLSAHFDLVPDLGKKIAVCTNLPIVLIGSVYLGFGEWQLESLAFEWIKEFLSVVPVILFVWILIKLTFQYAAIGRWSFVAVTVGSLLASSIFFDLYPVKLALVLAAIDGLIIAFYYDEIIRLKQDRITVWAAVSDALLKSKSLWLQGSITSRTYSDYIFKRDPLFNFRKLSLLVGIGIFMLLVFNPLVVWPALGGEGSSVESYRNVVALYFGAFAVYFSHFSSVRQTWLYALDGRRQLGSMILRRGLAGLVLVSLANAITYWSLTFYAGLTVANEVLPWLAVQLFMGCVYVTFFSLQLGYKFLEKPLFSHGIGSIAIAVCVFLLIIGAGAVGHWNAISISVLGMNIVLAVILTAYVARLWPSCNLSKRGGLIFVSP